MRNAIIVIGGVVVAIAAVVPLLPEIRRYMKLRSM
jgi:hypothetical protein